MRLCLQCDHVFPSNVESCSQCGYIPPVVDGIASYALEFAYGNENFKQEFFSRLADLESNNFWFKARNELITWALRKYGPFSESFLEVGCGTGFVLSGIAKKFPNIRLTGSELLLNGLIYAKTRIPQATFIQMDARLIPFSSEFDSIGAFDVLEHIVEDGKTLSQFYKALKPGGVLFLTVPQHPWLWSSIDDHACHVRRYTAQDIEQKIERAGFSILRSTSFMTFLLPFMMASRKLHQRQGRKTDPLSELRIPKFLNTLFYRIALFEISQIKRQKNLSLGGSRLIIGTKDG